MNLDKIRVDGIPALIWGESSDKMIIAAQGSHSSKIDDCMYGYAKEHAQRISLFGCSMGAYFQLLATNTSANIQLQTGRMRHIFFEVKWIHYLSTLM